MFIGYAPAENPSIAVAVMVEGGGYGGSTAAPIARKIFDAWLLKKPPADSVPDVGDAGTSTRIEVGITPAMPSAAPVPTPPPAPVTIP